MTTEEWEEQIALDSRRGRGPGIPSRRCTEARVWFPLAAIAKRKRERGAFLRLFSHKRGEHLLLCCLALSLFAAGVASSFFLPQPRGASKRAKKNKLTLLFPLSFPLFPPPPKLNDNDNRSLWAEEGRKRTGARSGTSQTPVRPPGSRFVFSIFSLLV